MLLLISTILLVSGIRAQRFLAVENRELRLNGEKVFMSGMNIAWHSFGRDFGDGQYDCCTGNQLEEYLRDIAAAGGNSIRIWIHCDGRMTPAFDSDGYVTGADSEGTFVSDLSRFLDVAYENNILVTLVLWNGAIEFVDEYRDLIWDESKLDSYINNALVPTVAALKDKVALASWEIMNEPEGCVLISSDSNACFDTTALDGSGAGWVPENVPMENLLRFINRQIAAIKQEDPKALATIGSWSERSQTNNFGYFNYYTDECLQAGGGQSGGIIDYYQMHTYEWDEGSYADTSPLLIHNSEYGLDKPNVVGEFSEDGGDGRDITSLIEFAYTNGYAGAWTWQANGGGEHSDDFDTQARAMRQLQGRNEEGGRIDIDLQ